MHATAHSTPKRAGEHPPTILDTPIGIKARGQRTETDSMGAIDVGAPRRNAR